jgi:hypothetical protein
MRVASDPLKKRAQAAIEKLRLQFPATPEGRLMHQVVALAISDLVPGINKHTLRPSRQDTESARDYLRGEIFHAAAAGVDPDYVRYTLFQAGVEF